MNKQRKQLTKTVTQIARDSGLKWCSTYSEKRKKDNQNVIDGYRTKLFGLCGKDKDVENGIIEANKKLKEMNLKLVSRMYGRFARCNLSLELIKI